MTDRKGPEANVDTHQCRRSSVFWRETLIAPVVVLTVNPVSACSHFFQVPSLTGLTADCFPSPFTLRNAALCAKHTKTPILTLQLTQLSSGNDDDHYEFPSLWQRMDNRTFMSCIWPCLVNCWEQSCCLPKQWILIVFAGSLMHFQPIVHIRNHMRDQGDKKCMSEAETLSVWSMKMFELLLFVRT